VVAALVLQEQLCFAALDHGDEPLANRYLQILVEQTVEQAVETRDT
jgi:hypothetical protein